MYASGNIYNRGLKKLLPTYAHPELHSVIWWVTNKGHQAAFHAGPTADYAEHPLPIVAKFHEELGYLVSQWITPDEYTEMEPLNVFEPRDPTSWGLGLKITDRSMSGAKLFLAEFKHKEFLEKLDQWLQNSPYADALVVFEYLNKTQWQIGITLHKKQRIRLTDADAYTPYGHFPENDKLMRN